jgi:hypothetical protein
MPECPHQLRLAITQEPPSRATRSAWRFIASVSSVMLKATITCLPVRSWCARTTAITAGTRSASGACAGSAQTSSSLMKSTPAAQSLATSAAVSAAESPTLGLMIVPTSAPLATPVARRVPAMPTRGISNCAR